MTDNACSRIAWLASIGARATVCCTRETGHDGPHRDDMLGGIEWRDDQ
ncbi:hypothetical protein SEA_SAMPSON_60 [Gordonia Phage Sampson]|uniref:Uncharacterized protein n=1 Tax=Gordonia Phage Sampson TaxID=2951393 RepID=A0A9E7NF59_9CAUD|nr:hypothetical protein SEA_SAMPSON_60 [Gordonia Phage Sampson]